MEMLDFIVFISSTWYPWLMTKWCGHPIVTTMIKKWLKVILYEHTQPYAPPIFVPMWGGYFFLLVIVEFGHLKIKISKSHVGPVLKF